MKLIRKIVFDLRRPIKQSPTDNRFHWFTERVIKLYVMVGKQAIEEAYIETVFVDLEALQDHIVAYQIPPHSIVYVSDSNEALAEAKKKIGCLGLAVPPAKATSDTPDATTTFPDTDSLSRLIIWLDESYSRSASQ